MSLHVPPDAGTEVPVESLRPGSRIGEFQIGELIGHGRHSAVYRARDRARGLDVALKEYLPAGIASRNARGLMVCKASDAAIFDQGRRRFMREGQEMARVEHGSLLRVWRAWEAAGSAYWLMPLVQGRALDHVFGADGRAPTQAEALALLRPLLDLLSVLHQRQCSGLDLQAHGVLLQPDGRPLLMRLGPRDQLPPLSPDLTVASRRAAPPWQDLQALARLMLTLMQPALASGSYQAGFMAALRAAASDDPAQRPPDARALMNALDLPERRARVRLGRERDAALWLRRRSAASVSSAATACA